MKENKKFKVIGNGRSFEFEAAEFISDHGSVIAKDARGEIKMILNDNWLIVEA